MRVQLPQELQEQIEREAQDTGVSKQTKLLEIVDSYFGELEKKEEDPLGASRLALLDSLEKRYKELYLEHEWLKGEYALATTKLLPAAERTMTPWYSRLKRWLLGK